MKFKKKYTPHPTINQAFFEPATFHDCPPIPIPVPKLPNPVSVILSPVAERGGGIPEGAAVEEWPEKPERKELVGTVWIDKNLFGGGRSSLLC
jgi:hypothetical protein